MNASRLMVLAPIVLIASMLAPLPLAAGSASPTKGRAVRDYGKIPLHFEANTGQTDSQVQFLARGRGYSLFLTPTEAVLSLDNARSDREKKSTPNVAVLRMSLVGANPRPRVTGLDPLPSRSNYFVGSDPRRWQTNVPHFAKVRYQQVYPGVDLFYYGNQQQLEYDLVVAPNADPSTLRLHFDGAKQIRIEKDGTLAVKVGTGEVSFRAPIIYQEVKGERRSVSGGYVLNSSQEIAFRVSNYDKTLPLTIDPMLVYSTYLAGKNDIAKAVAVDGTGNAYVAGWTSALDFPTTPGALPYAGNGDAYVTKLNPDGSAIVYSTFLGGTDGDSASDIAVDTSGSVYVTGRTSSMDFPTTQGVVKPSCHPDAQGHCGDAFVTKLDPGGSLAYSTYLGGSGREGDFLRIAVSPERKAYVTGRTNSLDFPTTQGAFRMAYNGGDSDLFVAKLNDGATALDYATYFGGSSSESGSLAVDASGNAFLAGPTTSGDFPYSASEMSCPGSFGWTNFIAKLNAQGSALVYSTRVCSALRLVDIAVGEDGSVYVTGAGAQPLVPLLGSASVNSAAQDIFVGKLKPDGSDFQYAIRFGGGVGSDVGLSQQPIAVAVESNGTASIAGITSASDFPVVNPIQSHLAFGMDVFVTKVNASGDAILFSTYLGGSCPPLADGTWNLDRCLLMNTIDYDFEQANDVAVDSTGNLYIVGQTIWTDFPMLNALFPQKSDNFNYAGFVVKIGAGDNTLAGAAVSVLPAPRVSLTFDNVSTPGTTSVTHTSPWWSYPPPVPAGFSVGDPPSLYDISTTAVFSGPIRVCINYGDVDYGLEVGLQLLHYEDGQWNDVTLRPGYPDTVNKIVCGEVISLSPFLIARAPLPPLRPEGLLAPLAALVPTSQTPPLPDKAFKLGKTVPLKFKLFAGDTLVTQNEAPPPRLLGLQRTGEAPLQLDTLDLDAGESSDNSLLFHCEGGNWVYNLKTTNLTAGTYLVTIQMPDGGSFKAGFVLK